jgi:heme O synthase-like polyprenyltransferase
MDMAMIITFSIDDVALRLVIENWTPQHYNDLALRLK